MNEYCINIFTTRKRSLGQGNIFSSVCQEFCPQKAGVPGQVHPLGRYTPQAGKTPWAGTPPWTGTPNPPWQVHPPTHPEQCMLGDTGNKQAVRILLECMLVYKISAARPWFVRHGSNCFTFIDNCGLCLYY